MFLDAVNRYKHTATAELADRLYDGYFQPIAIGWLNRWGGKVSHIQRSDYYDVSCDAATHCFKKLHLYDVTRGTCLNFFTKAIQRFAYDVDRQKARRDKVESSASPLQEANADKGGTYSNSALDEAAVRNGQAQAGVDRSLDAMHHKQLLDQLYAMSDEHALVVTSLRRGSGLHNNRPSLIKLAEESGLPRDRVTEILDDFRDLISEAGGL